MKRLILNADDFGLTRGVNQGIIRAHQHGILTSTTLMATAPEFEDACALARANQSLGVGCHIVLVGGTAVTPPEKISSLADQSGALPKSLLGFAAKVSRGQIRANDIATEVAAQIQKIRAAGIEPTHIDTHKHTHAHPKVMDVIGQVARDCRITRIRRPIEQLGKSWEGGGLSKQFAAAVAVRTVANEFQSLAQKYGLRAPDHFLGLAMTGQLGRTELRRMIENLPEGTVEIMLHPGICDGDLASTRSRLQQQRQLELDGLTDSDVKLTIAKEGIQLITYTGLN
ncbi:MAG TPA: ChbG/HpnK family deacetylase [Candidatus Acidoferrales bacterium]|jgi:hopanoid biosynthesis associated protein HpnK|nr:ChbG/HpnK family deacetylase [Candidatus Acidoferrales bacterium]